jgi:hypothetical protein
MVLDGIDPDYLLGVPHALDHAGLATARGALLS